MITQLQPGPGWIGLVRIRGRAGAAIRLGQWLNGDGWADVEHAFVYAGDALVVEAEPGGARLAPLAEYASTPIVWLRCPPGLGPAVTAAARAMLGAPYSFADYDALALHRLHVPAPGLQRYIADTGHMICSQLADEAARRGGWHLFADGRWPGYVTPGALRALARTQEGTLA